MVGSERAALKLARSAFAVRVIVAILTYTFFQQGLFAGDENTYDRVGAGLANYWRGTTAFNPMAGLGDESKGFFYIVAALYYPFGQYPILPKLLNAWIGSRAVLELFRVTKLIGGSESAALRAAQFLAFFPSQILWSSLLLRDVWVQWLLMRMARELAELKGRLIPSRIISVGLLIWGSPSFGHICFSRPSVHSHCRSLWGAQKTLCAICFLGHFLCWGSLT